VADPRAVCPFRRDFTGFHREPAFVINQAIDLSVYWYYVSRLATGLGTASSITSSHFACVEERGAFGSRTFTIRAVLVEHSVLGLFTVRIASAVAPRGWLQDGLCGLPRAGQLDEHAPAERVRS